MLSFAEEIYLLALDDSTGQFSLNGGQAALRQALIVAILGELSFLHRIDSDIETLIVLDASEVGNPILDSVLTPLRAIGTGPHPLLGSLDKLNQGVSDVITLTRQELMRKQIIKEVSGRLLWVIPSRRYPVVDSRELVDVERRLHALIIDPDVIPDPRDTVLVSLVAACGLFPEILSPREMRRHQQRIDSISHLDLIGGNLIQSLQNQNLAIASACGY
jgi:golgi phosphoprotein 3